MQNRFLITENCRFNCPDFKNLILLLDELIVKKTELKTAADQEGAESVAFSKHTAIENLVKEYRKKIDTFNLVKTCDHDVDEMVAKLKIIDELRNFLAGFVQENYATLATPRPDTKRDTANKALKVISIGGTLTYSIASGFSLIGIFFRTWGADMASTIFQKYFGTNKSTPTASLKLLKKLAEKLTLIQNNFTDYLQKNPPSKKTLQLTCNQQEQ